MARLVDTSIRLLSQEPFVGRISTARILRLAEDLDSAGYAALEVTGGGCFAGAVARAVESPWERIRALKARTTTPLVMALRGTFLVGPRPADADLVRRFILCAAESGIDIFRLHDPLNDIDDLLGPVAAVREAGATVWAGLVYSDASASGGLVERARRLSELGADRVLLHDPAGALDPAGAGALIGKMREASGVPVGLFAQGAGGTALAVAIEAARAGADPIATASYPVAMLTQRPAAELLTQALTGLGLEAGLDREIGWEVALRIEAEIGDAAAVAPPISPQVALPRRSRPCRPASSPRSSDGSPRWVPPTGSTRCSTRCAACATSAARRRLPRRSGASSPRRRSSTCSARAAGSRSTRRCAACCSASTGTPRARSTRRRGPSPRRRLPRTSRSSRSTRHARRPARSRPPRRSSVSSPCSASARSRCSRACAGATSA